MAGLGGCLGNLSSLSSPFKAAPAVAVSRKEAASDKEFEWGAYPWDTQLAGNILPFGTTALY